MQKIPAVDGIQRNHWKLRRAFGPESNKHYVWHKTADKGR